MLKLLLINAILVPAGILAATNSQSPIENNIEAEDVSFFEQKLDALKSCEDTSIYIAFQDEYMETYASEYLHNAMSAVKNCGLNKVSIEASSEDEKHLRKARHAKVHYYISHHDIKASTKTSETSSIIPTNPYGLGYARISFKFTSEPIKTASSAS